MSESKQTYLIVGVSGSRPYVNIRGEKGNVVSVEYFDVDQHQNAINDLLKLLRHDPGVVGVCIDLLSVQNWFIKTPATIWTYQIPNMGIPVVLSNEEYMYGYGLHEVQ